jgi:hypothetical protein
MEIRKKASAITSPKTGRTVKPLTVNTIDIKRKNSPNPNFENLSNTHEFSIIIPPFMENQLWKIYTTKYHVSRGSKAISEFENISTSIRRIVKQH